MPALARHLGVNFHGHHAVLMRTTLTLDDDVFAALEQEARRTHKPFKQVVNEALRRGLGPHTARPKTPAYVPPVFDAKLLGGVDPAALNRLADELEEERAQARAGRDRSFPT